jgi:sulfite reductase (ferredoxin)
MNKLSQEFRQDIQDFKKTADQFFNHEMSTKEYKGISGGYGTYAQADPSLSMLRLRFTGGRVSPAQMKCIANKLRQHDISLLHFTTCQCIQLHNLSKDVLLDTMGRRLWCRYHPSRHRR